MSDAMSVAKNLSEVQKKIAAACLRAGRSVSDVTLIAVSKTKSIEMINEAAQAGQRAFGENYVQEILPKVLERPDLEWHFIGSLQTNKVKAIVGKVALIHSVDRAKLLAEIAKNAASIGVRQKILLEFNAGDESTKSGATREDILAMVTQSIEADAAIEVCGLMALPPLFDSETEARASFAKVRALFDEAKERLPTSARANFKILSMGTSADFEAAILEGATHVRVGTSIFGSRS
jgi:pyridoxal phosphate enzyme (YggS family)